MRRLLGIVLAVLSLALVPLLVAPAPARAAASGITGTIGGVPASWSPLVEVVPVTSGPDVPSHPRQYWLEDGSFRISLAPGAYWVRFAASPAQAPEWWGDAVTRGTSTQVVVAADTFTTIDPVLEQGGTISGTVPDAATSDPSGFDRRVEVWADDPSRPEGRELVTVATIDAAGAFTTTALPTGTYVLRAITRRTPREDWYAATAGVASSSGATDDGATPVSVTAPASVTGVDILDLHDQGLVSGRLTRGDGAVLDGVDVQVLRRDDDGRITDGYSISTLTTGGGRWAVQEPAGSYTMLFGGSDRDGIVTEAEFWGHGTTVDAARTVAVAVGATAVADHVVEPTSVVVRRAPHLGGSAQVGRTLSVVGGSVYPSDARRTYQWLRGGRPIAGAVRASYTLRPEDADRDVSVRTTISRPGYESRAVTLTTPLLVDRAQLRRVSRARFGGELRVGATLRATAPRTAPRSTPHYQWRRGGSPIRGATGPTYTLRRADRGEYVSLWVASRRPGYDTVWWAVQRLDAVRPR